MIHIQSDGWEWAGLVRGPAFVWFFLQVLEGHSLVQGVERAVSSPSMKLTDHLTDAKHRGYGGRDSSWDKAHLLHLRGEGAALGCAPVVRASR